MKKSVIIYNPASGKIKRKEMIKTFYDILRKHGYENEIIYTS